MSVGLPNPADYPYCLGPFIFIELDDILETFVEEVRHLLWTVKMYEFDTNIEPVHKVFYLVSMLPVWIAYEDLTTNDYYIGFKREEDMILNKLKYSCKSVIRN